MTFGDGHPLDPRAAWETGDARARPIAWSARPVGDDGEGDAVGGDAVGGDAVGGDAIEGPFDLGFAAGRGLELTVGRGETVLMCRRGEVHAVYLEGRHLLRIADGRTDALPGNGRLTLIHDDRIIRIPWRGAIPLPGRRDPSPLVALAAGRFDVLVVDPLLLQRTVLRDGDEPGAVLCRAALAHLVPTVAALRLANRDGADGSRVLRDVLAGLQPCDLAPGLARYGLACAALHPSPDGAAADAFHAAPLACP